MNEARLVTFYDFTAALATLPHHIECMFLSTEADRGKRVVSMEREFTRTLILHTILHIDFNEIRQRAPGQYASHQVPPATEAYSCFRKKHGFVFGHAFFLRLTKPHRLPPLKAVCRFKRPASDGGEYV